MLAHQQGCTLNLSKLSASLGIDGKTTKHYINLLEGPYLLRSKNSVNSLAGVQFMGSQGGLIFDLAIIGNKVCFVSSNWQT
jgi:hypothetical protein